MTPVRYAKSPDRKTACGLLHEIAKKPVSCGSRTVDKPLVLYGAGDLGKMAKEYFDTLGIPFLFVVDVNPDLQKKNHFWTGINILSPHEVPTEVKESALLAICIATVPFSTVVEPLKEHGWLDIVPFYDIAEAYIDKHPLSNGWFTGTLSKDDIFGIESVLYRWEDDISRAHHIQFIAWHRLREDWLFEGAPIDAQRRYFIPEIMEVLSQEEMFVDVGAHRGEASEAFRRAVGGSFDEILMFEPDPVNAAAIAEALDRQPTLLARQRLLRIALSRTSGGGRFFAGLGYASQLSAQGQEIVEVRTLDELGVNPTFVKMHLEGHELDALRGAQATLQQSRPLVAVTAYHNDAGLWRLPAWLSETLADYRFHFRLHAWCGTAAVLYGVPIERQQANSSSLAGSSNGSGRA